MKINTHILSTVELNDNLLLSAMEHGVEIDALSFIQVEPVKDIHLDEEIADLCKMPLTAVFTSANAVAAMADLLKTGKPDWNIYCIGNATKKAVLDYFDEFAVKGTAFDAALLANVIKTHGVKEVAFFCGNKRLDALPVFLFQNDIMVHEVVVYKTIETPEQVRKRYQGIMFFSPNGVNSYLRVNDLDPHTVLFAIGHTTAGALKARVPNKIVICEAPSKERMVEKVIEYFHK